MRQRVLTLIRIYVLLLLLNIVQKPVFMFIDRPMDTSLSVKDYWEVLCHGLLLDFAVTGYVVALPLLFTMASIFWNKRIAVRKIATPYYLVIVLLTSLIFVADLSLYPFWKFKLDATIFYYIDSPKNAMASVSVGFILCRVVAFVLLTAGCTLLLRRATAKQWQPVRSGYWGKVGYTGAMLLVIGWVVISIRGGVGKSTTNIGGVYFSEREFLNHSAVNPTFSLLYSLNKANNYAEKFRYFPEEECAKRFEGLFPTTTVESDTMALLTTTRPNVLVILMEGMGGTFTRDSVITPNYHRLSQEGILFTNCYSNSYRTDRGVVSTLSGHVAYPTVSIMKLPIKSRTLPCLAQSLNREGYQSSFLYGGDINFTNMQSYLRTGGYGTIVSDVDFSAKERATNDWGVNDDITFTRLFERIQSQTHTPWHIGFLTLSSHEPWTVPTHRLENEKENAFAYTDACLGDFVAKLKKTEAWKNLLIVCIPDHGVIYPENIAREDIHRNTMLWIGGAVRAPKKIETLMNQSDMAATLLGQLHIDHEDYPFSRDILSTEYTYPFAYFTYPEGAGLRDSTGCSLLSIIKEETEKETAGKQRVEHIKTLLQETYYDLDQRR